MGMGLTTVLWAALFALSFEFARVFSRRLSYVLRETPRARDGSSTKSVSSSSVPHQASSALASGSILRDLLKYLPFVGSGIFLIRGVI